VFREAIVHNRHLRRENAKFRQLAAMTNQSCQPPPCTNRISRNQVKISTNALIIRAKALTSTFINSNLFTYAEAMDSPQLNHWKRAMEEECTLILLNNTFTTINSQNAGQLQVKQIGSKWVYKMKCNPDGTIWYNAGLVITPYESTDCVDTEAPVGQLTTSRYLISLVRHPGSNIDH